MDAIFLEVHDEPEKAPCDGPNMVRLGQLKRLLERLREIDEVAKGGAAQRADESSASVDAG